MAKRRFGDYFELGFQRANKALSSFIRWTSKILEAVSSIEKHGLLAGAYI